MSNGPPRNCASCVHYNVEGDTCRHPQAVDSWGRLKGMKNFLPDLSYAMRRWPTALGWCGFFTPDETWLDWAARIASATNKQPKQKEVA